MKISIPGLCFLGLFNFLVALFNSSSQNSLPEVTIEIQQILEAQKNAWNRGDLERFMTYYWKSENLTFQSGANKWRGWQTLLERYKRNYPREKMGQLDFTDLEVNLLNGNAAYVLGKWQLTFEQEKREGRFTLIWKRFPEGWRIIHDHTS